MLAVAGSGPASGAARRKKVPADFRLDELREHDEAKRRALVRMADMERSREVEPVLPVEGLGGIEPEDLLGSARASLVLDRCKAVHAERQAAGRALVSRRYYGVLDLLPPPADVDAGHWQLYSHEAGSS